MEDVNTLEIFAKQKGDDIAWLKRLSFTSILTSANLLQTMFTNTLDGITSKQWLLLTVASSLQEAPTLSEIGKVMGCSRQNIKQITEILKKNGYVQYCKLEGDKNTIRIQPTKKWQEYNEQNREVNLGLLDHIFDEFSDAEIKTFFESFCKIIKNVENINRNFIK